MSWSEFCEWIVFDQLEPIGDRRADLQAAIVASTIANVNRPRGHRAHSPIEFMPKFDPETPQQRAAKLHAKMKAIKERAQQAAEVEELKQLFS